ncbi:MAG TPA: hypothetical protein VML19_22810 [Verrucomicrobiae bacterium]|nr:hypothetical protein [Verrucomicrobiae bacterium]
MRYALGELTPEERDSFEDHFADCSFCMDDVGMASAFAANAREVYRQRAATGTPVRRFAWLRLRPFPTLALSAALNVLLVAGVGYDLAQRRTAPAGGVTATAEPQTVEIVPIQGVTRGAGPKIVKASRLPVVLSADLPQSYAHYFYSIDRAGSPVLSGELDLPGGSEALNLQIPVSRLAPGEYLVTLAGDTAGGRETLATCTLHVQR